LVEDHQHDRPETATVKEIQLPSPSGKNHNELSLLTQPLRNSSPNGSTRVEQSLNEDHQQNMPEPTTVKEVEKPPSDKNYNELSLLTQPQHSSPYGSTREEQPLVEDHQHDRPETTIVKEVGKSLPSDYTCQILSEP
jgi:hypothetical protein